MSYTSEQYKYLLMKRLQRHFSMDTAKDRAYTQSFFWALFDDSVTVTEETYDNFVLRMDEQLVICAEYNVYKAAGLGDIPSSVFDQQQLLMIDAFAAVGIALEIQTSSGYKAVFTKSNGEVMTYSNTNFKINCKAKMEYQYARASAQYYNMRDMKVPGADEIDPKIAGPGTYWSYNAETASVTITGDGAYSGAPTEEQLGSGAYTTVIIGADVSRLLSDCLEYSSIATIVLLHAADAPLVIDSGAVGSKNTKTWTVYTDNEDFRGFAWPSNVSITWHALDEWEG